MNKRNIVNTIFNNYHSQGVVRKQASFFGKPIGGSFDAHKVPPTLTMMQTFSMANLLLEEPSFFGTPVSEFVNRRKVDGQVSHQSKIFDAASA